MHIRSVQDAVTALMFVSVGVAALWIGADYPVGTAQRPGTGVLPQILAWSLIACGGLLGIKSLLVAGPGLSAWAWRPAIMVTLSNVAFALLIEPLGLVATMLISMTLTALGTPETRWREYAIFSLIMLAIGVSTFIWGLGMPLKVLPWN